MPSSGPGIMTVSLAEAEIIAAGAIEKANELGIKIAVTVCDAGGRFVVFKRMNGAPGSTVDRAKGKALVSAAFNLSTGRLAPAPGEKDVNHIHQQVSLADGDHMLFAQGAVAVFRNGLAVGSCGVDGGTGAQDEACARAGTVKLEPVKA